MLKFIEINDKFSHVMSDQRKANAGSKTISLNESE